MKRTWQWFAGVGGIVSVAGVAFVTGRAAAGGIPSKLPILSYSGVLQDGTGKPVTGNQTIEVRLGLPASPAFNELCTSSRQIIPVDASGHFTIPLDDCVAAVRSNSDLYAEVRVGTTSLGIAKLGAVPYAVEAAHAAAADSAATADTAVAASGALAAQLAAIQGQLHPVSAFRASVTTTVSIPPNAGTRVLFDRVDFDLAGEYDNATGIFTPKQAGYYLVQCAFEYQDVGDGPFSWSAELDSSRAELAISDTQAGGSSVSSFVSTIVELAAGETVVCRAWQSSPGLRKLFVSLGHPESRLNSFSAVRLY